MGWKKDAYKKYSEEAGKQCEKRYALNEALKMYNATLGLVVDTRNKIELLDKIGDLNFVLSKFDSARKAYEKAINIDPEIVNKGLESMIYFETGKIYKEGGNIKTALEFNKKSFKIANSKGFNLLAKRIQNEVKSRK